MATDGKVTERNFARAVARQLARDVVCASTGYVSLFLLDDDEHGRYDEIRAAFWNDVNQALRIGTLDETVERLSPVGSDGVEIRWYDVFARITMFTFEFNFRPGWDQLLLAYAFAAAISRRLTLGTVVEPNEFSGNRRYVEMIAAALGNYVARKWCDWIVDNGGWMSMVSTDRTNFIVNALSKISWVAEDHDASFISTKRIVGGGFRWSLTYFCYKRVDDDYAMTLRTKLCDRRDDNDSDISRYIRKFIDEMHEAPREKRAAPIARRLALYVVGNANRSVCDTNVRDDADNWLRNGEWQRTCLTVSRLVHERIHRFGITMIANVSQRYAIAIGNRDGVKAQWYATIMRICNDAHAHNSEWSWAKIVALYAYAVVAAHAILSAYAMTRETKDDVFSHIVNVRIAIDTIAITMGEYLADNCCHWIDDRGGWLHLSREAQEPVRFPQFGG